MNNDDFNLSNYVVDSIAQEYGKSEKLKKKIYYKFADINIDERNEAMWEFHQEIPDSSSAKIENAEKQYNFFQKNKFNEYAIEWKQEVERLKVFRKEFYDRGEKE